MPDPIRSEVLVSVNDYQAALRRAPRYRKKEPDPLALTASQYVVAMEMATFADYADGRNCRPGVDTIADLTKLDRTTVMRVRDELEAAGWLEVVGERGSKKGSTRTTRYRLSLPTGCVTPPVTGRTTPPVTGGTTPPVANPTGRTTHTTGRTTPLTGRMVRPDLLRPSMTKTAESICPWCECPLDRPGSFIDEDGKDVVCGHDQQHGDAA